MTTTTVRLQNRSHTHISLPKRVNPRDIAGDAEEEEEAATCPASVTKILDTPTANGHCPWVLLSKRPKHFSNCEPSQWLCGKVSASGLSDTDIVTHFPLHTCNSDSKKGTLAAMQTCNSDLKKGTLAAIQPGAWHSRASTGRDRPCVSLQGHRASLTAAWQNVDLSTQIYP